MPIELFFLILAIFSVLFLSLFWIINKKLSEIANRGTEDQVIIEWLKSNQELLSQSNKNITDTLQQNTRDINIRLDRAAQIIAQLQKEAGRFGEISQSIRELQEFLKSPKLRGGLGEEVLKDLLLQTFPRSVLVFQYEFSSGERVDAGIKTDAGLLPIDSKFPLENFRKLHQATGAGEKSRARKEFIRDVKKHIGSIAQKYIVPDEGTLDFAIMYVPSESVFYEIINLPEIVEHAKKMRVYLVSPNTLYVYLAIILVSFEGNRIEQRARMVLGSLRSIQKDYERLGVIIGKLTRHVTHAYNVLNTLSSSFTRLGRRITSTQSLSSETIESAKEIETSKQTPVLES